MVHTALKFGAARAVALAELTVSCEMTSNPLAIQHCVECGALSPPAALQQRSLGEQVGWHLTRQPTRDGRTTLEWRCPPCSANRFERGQSA